MSSYGTTSAVMYCHRCGKPSAQTYINGMPTCPWCIAELDAHKPSPCETFHLTPTYPVGMTEDRVREIVREVLREEATRDE